MGRYLPGYKDGGPVRSTKNLIDLLGNEYDIRVACYDRDAGDSRRYPGIRINSWNKVGNGLVYYVPEKGFTNKIILDLAKQVDIIYIWGCFDVYARKVLLLKRFGFIKNKVVVAGMGLFSPMAFRMKYIKKKAAVTVFNVAGIFKNVYWSVTSEREKSEILQQVWAKDNAFFIAEDLSRKVDGKHIVKKKREGHLDVVWISRIAPKKNLLMAIQILERCLSQINFSIYGPVFDEKYWNSCQAKLKMLPPNICWEYKGSVDSEQVVETLKHYHVFLFPTLGENYGHVIQEALSAGCPCILSDQTPWQDLEENNAGYVIPIKKVDEFISVVEKYAELDQKEYDRCCNDALNYAIRKSNLKVKNTGYRDIFKL